MHRYLEAAAARGVTELGFSEHVHRFRQALDVWRHPFWEENAVDDLDEYCEFVQEMKQPVTASSSGSRSTTSPGGRSRSPR